MESGRAGAVGGPSTAAPGAVTACHERLQPRLVQSLPDPSVVISGNVSSCAQDSDLFCCVSILSLFMYLLSALDDHAHTLICNWVGVLAQAVAVMTAFLPLLESGSIQRCGASCGSLVHSSSVPTGSLELLRVFCPQALGNRVPLVHLLLCELEL